MRSKIRHTILQLTHTDILRDGRIMKSIWSLEKKNYKVFGFGVALGERNKKSALPIKAQIKALKIFSRKVIYTPRIIKTTLMFLEVSFKIYRAVNAKTINVIHCHDVVVLPIAVILKKKYGCKLIYDAHELESRKHGITPMLSFFIFWVEKYCWKHVDGLISVSQSIIDWYKFFFPTTNYALILNSPLTKKTKFKKNSFLRKHFAIPSGSLIYVYVGLMVDGRALDYYTKAFVSQKTTSSLVLIGYGQKSESLKKLSQNHPNIYFMDALPHEKLIYVLRGADVGLCLIENSSLSDFYSLPNKLLEYLFSDLKVICSEFPEMSKVVKSLGVGVTCKDNYDSFLQAFHQVEKEKASIMNYDLYQFSYVRQEQLLFNFYKKILGEEL